MADTIAELVVKIGVKADSDEVKALENATDGAGDSALSAREAFGGFAKGLAVVATVAAGAVVSLVALADSTAKAGDEIAKNARATGISAEAYQKQRFAFDLAGVSQGAFEKGTRRIGQELERVRNGDVTPFSKAIAQAGISIDDFTDNDTQLLTYLDAVGKVGDESQRVALLTIGLGDRIGGQMATAAETSKEKMLELGEGLKTVFSEEQLTNAENYVDAQTEMTDAIDSVKLASIELIPLLTEGIDEITDWIAENEELIQQDLPAFVEGLSDKVRELIDFFGQLTEDTQFLIDEFESLKDSGSGVGEIIEFIDDTVDSLNEAWDSMGTKIREVLEEFLGFERAERIIRNLQNTLNIGLGLATAGGVQIGGGDTNPEAEAERAKVKADAKDKEREDKKASRAKSRATNLEDKKRKARQELAGAASAIEIAAGGRGVSAKQRGAFSRLGEALSSGEISARDARSQIAAIVGGRTGGRGGGGKKKKKDKPTPAELIEAAATGRPTSGGTRAPTPNVAIVINNNNNFDMQFDITGIESPAQFIEAVEPKIQQAINMGNVEAARLLQPTTLR